MADAATPDWHIGLNAHLLSGRPNYRGAGIHQYVRNLLAHLPSVEPGLRFTAMVGPDAPSPPMAILRSRLPTARPIVRIFWEQLIQPWVARRAGFDLFHSMAFVIPLAYRGPQVVTVYDLSFELAPERFSAARRSYLSTFTALSCRRAQRVLAISENTRADVIRLYGVPLERVDVAYPGIGPQFRPYPQGAVQEFRSRSALPEKFVLYLGTIEPRKNLELLIRAFAHLQLPEVKLVLAGGRGWMYKEILRLVEYLQLNGSVIFPGYVAARDLPLWYNAASVFAYPSVYEGFGIPPAEAMACGTPVVVADTSSIPEVVGQGALRVPADSVEALAEALHQALVDSTVIQCLRERGPIQASRFTWMATARATAACYRRALAAMVAVEEAPR